MFGRWEHDFKLQICLYISKFWCIYAIGIRINKKALYLLYFTEFYTPPPLPFVSLVLKRKFGKISRSLKILYSWLYVKFTLLFMFLLRVPIKHGYITVITVKNSYILAGIYFIFLKNVLDQTYEFGSQWKIGKVVIKYEKI